MAEPGLETGGHPPLEEVEHEGEAEVSGELVVEHDMTAGEDEMEGLFDADGEEKDGEAYDEPVPLYEPSMVERLAIDCGSGHDKLCWVFDPGARRGLACVPVRCATSGEVLVAIPGSFRPPTPLPSSPSGRRPAGKVDSLDALGQPTGRQISIQFVVLDEVPFHQSTVWWWDDIETIGVGAVFFGGRAGVWPDPASVVNLAESLGFGPAAGGEDWLSAVEGAPEEAGMAGT